MEYLLNKIVSNSNHIMCIINTEIYFEHRSLEVQPMKSLTNGQIYDKFTISFTAACVFKGMCSRSKIGAEFIEH